MGGQDRELSYLNRSAVTTILKAELLITFVKVHIASIIFQKRRGGAETELKQGRERLCRKKIILVGLKCPFLDELNRVLDKMGQTAPGKDVIYYCLIKHLSESLGMLLLYKKVRGTRDKKWI